MVPHGRFFTSDCSKNLFPRGLWMEIELQLGCGFSASWRVFPILQRVLDGAQAQRPRQQRTPQDSSLTLVSHLHVPLELAFRSLLNALDLPCAGQACN